VEHAKDWPKSVAKQVGQRVAYFRERSRDERGRKLTAQALADKCEELGVHLGRPTIAKLEKGLRETITVGELHALAKALSVSPADLVFPVGQAADVEVLPGQRMDTWDAVLWFSGFAAQPGGRAPNGEGVIHLYQSHHAILREGYAGKPFWAEGPAAEQVTAAALRAVRTAMRERGLLLPELPPELAYVDNGDAQ
jgi:transcriptional regulator with XRE-family HTH domain